MINGHTNTPDTSFTTPKSMRNYNCLVGRNRCVVCVSVSYLGVSE